MIEKAIVIGGGVHGITSAIALAEQGIAVVVLEKRDDLMHGTSGATHNRAHLGYHYPRSKETAIECIEGLEYFKRRYPSALFYPAEAYYLVSREGSKISFEEYRDFCDQVGIPYQIETASRGFWDESTIELGFKVPEPVFDMPHLAGLLKAEALSLGVMIVTGAEVVAAERVTGGYRIETLEAGEKKIYEAGLVINATYAYANNILKILDLESDMVKYELQKTEVVLARSPRPLPAMTVIDGKFVSVMPLAGAKGKDLFLIYDVVNSVIDKEEGYFLDDTKKYPTNFTKMVEHGKMFFPFMAELEYVASQYGFRPIRREADGDSRKTRIVSHKTSPGVYSILEGKCISAPLIAGKLVEQIRADGLI